MVFAYETDEQSRARYIQRLDSGRNPEEISQLTTILDGGVLYERFSRRSKWYNIRLTPERYNLLDQMAAAAALARHPSEESNAILRDRFSVIITPHGSSYDLSFPKLANPLRSMVENYRRFPSIYAAQIPTNTVEALRVSAHGLLLLDNLESVLR